MTSSPSDRRAQDDRGRGTTVPGPSPGPLRRHHDPPDTDRRAAARRDAERGNVLPRPPDPHDVRLVPLALAVWLAAGIGLGASVRTVLLVAAACAAGSALLLVAGRRRPVALVLQAALVLGGAAVSLSVVGIHHADRASHAVHRAAADGEEVVVEGVVLSDPVPSFRDRVRFTLAVTTVAPAGRPAAEPDATTGRRSGGQVLVLAPAAQERTAIGSTIRVTADAAPAGRADQALALLFADDPPEQIRPPRGLRGGVDRLREGLRAATAELSPQARGLVPGVALGDDRALPPDLADAARVTGLTHLTAVSGAHVSLVIVLVLGVVGRGRPRAAVLLAPAVVVGLVLLVRPEPSVLRAAATGGVVLLAGLLGRPARALPALATAVVALLLADPTLARSYGLVLSAGATAAIIVLTHPIARMLSFGVPRWLARGLAVPAAAQLVCGPVLVLLDPRLALTAVPANILAAPVVPGATLLGLAAAVVSPLAPWLATTLAVLASWHTAWIAWVARTLAAAPAATVPWPQGAAGVASLAAATVVLCLVLHHLVTTGRRVRVLVVLGLLPGLGGLLPGTGPDAPDGWAVLQCDVGQGSALLVRTGPVSGVLVDVGEADGAAATCVRDAGMELLDAVVLTHDHSDHTGGLPALLASVPVGEVVVPDVDGASPMPRARGVIQEAGLVVPVRAASAGDELHLGGLTARVLHPAPGVRARPEDSSSVNESSLALHLTLPVPGGEMTVLVAGDLEEAGQGRLARALGAAGIDRVDVAVVPHHGSGNLDPALARRARPSLALVSAGADNDHGHPARRALDTWGAAGARIARSDLCGPVWVVPDSGRLAVVDCAGEGSP